MTIEVKIIADSISPIGIRLTTLQLRYPRFIHAEFMTHRVFSRNASSSRAVPVKRLIEDIQRDTAMPLHWGRNQPGMQAREELNSQVSIPTPCVAGLEMEGGLQFLDWKHEMFDREEAWFQARDAAVMVATCFDRAGYHKQIVNRLLEPFSHINVVVSATEWKNFFLLRCHKDAQPEIRVLAEAMREEMNNNLPRQLEVGDWHLPYVADGIEPELGRKLSVARCARVSYLTHEGKEPTIAEDLGLYERLMGAVPWHASPAEHQATPKGRGYKLSNFRGWIQNRTLLES